MIEAGFASGPRNGFLTIEAVGQLAGATGELALSLAPVIGTAYDGYQLYQDLKTGHYYAAGIDGTLPSVSLVPGVKPTLKALETLVLKAKNGEQVGRVEVRGYGGASNISLSPHLQAQLIAEEVSKGHAFSKHIHEFANLGVTTQKQLQNFVERLVLMPSTVKRYASDGTAYYLDYTTKSIVIRGTRGEATVFRPDYDVGWEKYIEKYVPKRTVQPSVSIN